MIRTQGLKTTTISFVFVVWVWMILAPGLELSGTQALYVRRVWYPKVPGAAEENYNQPTKV